MPKVANFVYK